MIAILDYQAGNVASVKKALEHLGQASVLTADPGEVERADKILLPGVGHFSVTAHLAAHSLDVSLRRCVERGTPVLGICLGMQWMFESSEEAPEVRGAGIFPGRCQRFPSSIKCPHVGWNEVRVCAKSALFRAVGTDAFVYFAHTYKAPVVEDTVALTEYGGEFSAAVERGNIFGVQFHPEKSGDLGLTLLQNFCRL